MSCKRCRDEAPIGMKGIAELTNKPYNTVQSDHRRGNPVLPKQDFEVDGKPLWWPETIRQSGYGGTKP